MPAAETSFSAYAIRARPRPTRICRVHVEGADEVLDVRINDPARQLRHVKGLPVGAHIDLECLGRETGC